MAAYLATIADYLRDLVHPLPPGGDSTVLLWYRPRDVPVTYNTAYVLLDDPGVYAQWAGFFNGSTNDFEITGGQVAIAYATNTWVPLWWVQRGTTQSVYVAGRLAGTLDIDRSAFTVGFELLGNDTFGPGNVDVAYFRSYTAALRLGELQLESASPRAIRRANLWRDTPLESHVLDVSGNGRDWTAQGAVTFSTSPVLPSPAGVTDQDFFSVIQRKLLEPANGGASFFSGHWTGDELLQVAQDRQDALLRETHLQIGVARIDEIADQGTYDLPDDWIATVAVVRFPPTGRAYLVDLSDSFDSDMGQRTWDLASGRPTVCRDVEGQTRVLQLMPAPAAAGYLLVYYVPHSARLTGQGEVLTVPNELGLPVLQYGVLGDLLAKVGRGSDRPRAAYCQQRWQLGVEVTQILLKGLL